jgi:hypothetical protein
MDAFMLACMACDIAGLPLDAGLRRPEGSGFCLSFEFTRAGALHVCHDEAGAGWHLRGRCGAPPPGAVPHVALLALKANALLAEEGAALAMDPADGEVCVNRMLPAAGVDAGELAYAIARTADLVLQWQELMDAAGDSPAMTPSTPATPGAAYA